jgi:hypothetical protein
MSAILNQAWEDVADDVTGAIEKAVQPLLKKAVDEVYSGLLEATQDYLKDNLAFNIASRISAAEREAAIARESNRALIDAIQSLQGAITDLINDSEGVYGLHRNGDPAPWSELTLGGRFEEWIGLPLANADAAIAKAGGAA